MIPIVHPGTGDQKSTGSRIRIRNTVENLTWLPRGVLGGIGLLAKVGFPLGVMLMAIGVTVIDLGVMLTRPGFLMGVITPWPGFPLGVMFTTDLMAWQVTWEEDISLLATGSKLTSLTWLTGGRSFICLRAPGAAGTAESRTSATGCIPGTAAATWFLLPVNDGRIFLADGTGKEEPAPTEDFSAVWERLLLLLTEASPTEVITSTGAWGMPLIVVRSLLLDGISCCCWLCVMLGLDFWASSKAPTTDFQTLFRWGVGAVVGRGRVGVEEETTGLWQTAGDSRDPSPAAADFLLVMTTSLAWKTVQHAIKNL